MKVVIAGVAVAAALTSWGVSSVFAASPDPSAAPTTGASGTNGDSPGSGDHLCPAHDGTTTDSGSNSSS